MLWSLAILSVLVWVLGLVSSFTLGGLIHLLIVVAVVLSVMAVLKARAVEQQRRLEARRRADVTTGGTTWYVGGPQ